MVFAHTQGYPAIVVETAQRCLRPLRKIVYGPVFLPTSFHLLAANAKISVLPPAKVASIVCIDTTCA